MIAGFRGMALLPRQLLILKRHAACSHCVRGPSDPSRLFPAREPRREADSADHEAGSAVVFGASLWDTTPRSVGDIRGRA
jgi:hypothetical protein